jgi:hypothetical protein
MPGDLYYRNICAFIKVPDGMPVKGLRYIRFAQYRLHDDAMKNKCRYLKKLK